MGWSKEDYAKFRKGFAGKDYKGEKDAAAKAEAERKARKARALSRAKKKAAGTW